MIPVCGSLSDAAVAAVSLALAGTRLGCGRGRSPAGWMHAEINFFVDRVPHTLVLDRGRVDLGLGDVVDAAGGRRKHRSGRALVRPTQVTVNGTARPGVGHPALPRSP